MPDARTAPWRRLPLTWLGLVPFLIFSLLFLILPTGYIVLGAFRDGTGGFTLSNIAGLWQGPILKALSLVPVGIPASVENRLQPVPGDMAGLDLQGLIVASPGNPSGTMLGHDRLSALMVLLTPAEREAWQALQNHSRV